MKLITLLSLLTTSVTCYKKPSGAGYFSKNQQSTCNTELANEIMNSEQPKFMKVMNLYRIYCDDLIKEINGDGNTASFYSDSQSANDYFNDYAKLLENYANRGFEHINDYTGMYIDKHGNRIKN